MFRWVKVWQLTGSVQNLPLFPVMMFFVVWMIGLLHDEAGFFKALYVCINS